MSAGSRGPTSSARARIRSLAPPLRRHQAPALQEPNPFDEKPVTETCVQAPPYRSPDPSPGFELNRHRFGSAWGLATEARGDDLEQVDEHGEGVKRRDGPEMWRLS